MLHDAVTSLLLASNSPQEGTYARGYEDFVELVDSIVKEETHAKVRSVTYDWMTGLITGVISGGFLATIVMMVLYM